MKKIINIPLIIFSIIFIVFSMLKINDFKNQFMNYERDKEYLNYHCSIDDYKNTDTCLDYLNNGFKEYTYPAQYIFYNVVEEYPIGFLNVLSAFIVSAIVLYEWSKLINSGIIKYYLSRKEYSYLFKKITSSCLKYSFIYVALFLITYIMCIFASNFNFDISVLDDGVSFFGKNVLDLGALSFIAIWSSNVFVMSLIYSLCAIISIRIVNNYYGSIILSYLIFFVLLIISQIFIGTLIFMYVFNINTYTYFNLLNVFNLHDIPSLYIYFSIRVIIVALLYLIVYLMYRDKELFYNFVDKERKKIR